jgi:hypothetical protein
LIGDVFNKSSFVPLFLNLKFKFDPGTLDVGLYRLYTKIGYPRKNPMQHWMEESVYIKIEHHLSSCGIRYVGI